jgi:hypothetical protein
MTGRSGIPVELCLMGRVVDHCIHIQPNSVRYLQGLFEYRAPTEHRNGNPEREAENGLHTNL